MAHITTTKNGKTSELNVRTTNEGHKIESLAFKGFNEDLELLLASQIKFDEYLKSPEANIDYQDDELDF